MEDERLPRDTKVLTKLIPTIKNLFDIKGEIYLFVDEIHRIPNWDVWARRIHDMKKAQLFITGSTSRLSQDNIPRSLRGREITQRIMPLSFRDFLKFKNVKIEERHIEWSEDRLSTIKKLVKEYIEYGGMPEIVLLPKYKKRLLPKNTSKQ